MASQALCIVCGSPALKQCSGCKFTRYCSTEHQLQHWPNHKTSCGRTASTTSAAILDIGGDLMDFHFPLRDAIRSRASSCLYLDTLPKALAALTSPTPPSAIWITNEALAELPSLLSALRSYTERGGTIVLGGSLQSCITISLLDPLFESLGVGWKMGGYHRTTHALVSSHPRLAALPGAASLPQSYSMKAVLLKGVPDHEALYQQAEGSRHESLSMQLGGVEKVDKETPIAVGQVGKGWVAWIGDANADKGTEKVVLAIMGLGKD